MTEERPAYGVLVIEDDAIVRDWVRLALEGSEFRVAGEASAAAEALTLVERRRIDIVLVDQNLPDQLGTEVVRQMRRDGSQAPAVLMTASVQRGLNETAREAGVQASVLKSSDPERLLGALRSAMQGEELFDAAHPRRREGEAPLAPRERDVIRLVASGNTNKEIAAQLGIGDETVKTLLERTYAKLGVRRRAEAVLEAKRRGIV
jgi:two-component system NarL family response regulator